jgi:polyisoprenoid-binding protein YceI
MRTTLAMRNPAHTPHPRKPHMRTLRMATLATAFAFSLPASAATYTIDPGHTNVGFKVKHMMVSNVRGNFGDVSGTVEYDAAKPEATKVQATVKVVTINTGDAKRDEHLRAPDFFDAVAFPEIRFASTSVQNISASGFDVAGTLTMHGVSKPITFRFTTPSAEVKDPWGNTKSGFTATARINRQDWGVSWSKTTDQGGVVVSDEVDIEIEVELNRK